MLNKVHHVTYVVENIAEMSNYLEKSFGIKPISTDEFPDQGFKSILFRIGETLVDFLTLELMMLIQIIQQVMIKLGIYQVCNLKYLKEV